MRPLYPQLAPVVDELVALRGFNLGSLLGLLRLGRDLLLPL